MAPRGEADGDEDFPHWRRTLAAMLTVQVIMSGAFNFTTPVLPLFLPELGVSGDAQLYLWCGGLAAVTSLVAALLSPVWGRIADRRGRKQMVLRSTCAIGLCTILMGFCQDAWQMLGARILMGVFAGFSAATVILISTQVPTRRLTFALGVMSSGQLVGSLLGPVIGGAMADLAQSYRLPFFAGGVLSLGACLVCLFGVREVFVPGSGEGARRSVLASLRRLAGDRGLAALVGVLLLAQFATQAVQPIVALYVHDIVGDQPNLATLGGIALSATGLAGMVAVPLLGRAGDRIGETRVLILALAGAALATAPQAIAGSYGGFVAERLALGIFVGSIVPVANALIAKRTPAAERGVTLGITSSAYFLGNSFGPACGGAVAAFVGLPWVFVLTTALLAVGVAWVAAAVPGRGGERE